MKKIQGKSIEVNSTPAAVYNYLSDFNNFEHLMPEQISDWESTEEQCSFSITGMGKVGLKISEKQINESITYVPEGSIPFHFNLQANIKEISQGKCTIDYLINADLNPMLSMMASGPLKNLVDIMAEKTGEILNSK
jgi:carbon monoxide dehydrogenase subunit G